MFCLHLRKIKALNRTDVFDMFYSKSDKSLTIVDIISTCSLCEKI